jgi:Ni/Co efflux regulator RcnB
MKLKAIASLVMVSMLGMSSTVFAQPHGQGRDDHHGHGSHRPPSPHDAYAGRPGGPIPHSDWHKGDRLPAEYRDRNYVVDDWHSHGLSAPPRGYHWVGVNGDYVLAAVATGVIASVLISGH